MSTVHDPMKAPISLHGLGFIQVQLQGGQRLHVWHPDLPRRKCFLHSAIHNHRFGFESHVLVGRQININYNVFSAKENDATHRLYLHEGARTANGGRPWTPNAEVVMVEESRDVIDAGWVYRMLPYDFHRTEPGGDGRVATLMIKRGEGSAGAMSSCRIGIEPDTDFDRFQLTPLQLWMYVIEVLGGIGPFDQAEQDFIHGTDSYPPCDYCGNTPDHHPWHGSGILNGVESRHIHACNTCRHLLPGSQAELNLLNKVEHMAAYHEGPKGFFDWIDLQKSLRNGSQPGSPEGLNQPQKGGDQ